MAFVLTTTDFCWRVPVGTSPRCSLRAILPAPLSAIDRPTALAADLPVRAARSVTFRSQQLSSILGLQNLWIAFSGYWPERGALLETATFKELEVGGVLSRIRSRNFRALVVASAGNTAAAFARSCSASDIPCLVVVPSGGMRKMWFEKRLSRCVKTICLNGRASYTDAISLAERISRKEGFVSEGGVRNVGRRDGMATTMFSAVEAMGQLPDYYFQAIGSGAGAIAVHEAAKRLVEDSRFGHELPRLMLAQNAPFTPIVDAWKAGRRDLIEVDPAVARTATEQIVASVLSNQRPPYSIVGGVFDVLRESHGDMASVDNDAVLNAMKLFESCEGIDIDPAAGVALAALQRAASSGQIRREATVLLHITGGGSQRRAAEKTLFPVTPDLELSPCEVNSGVAVERACSLFAEPAPAGPYIRVVAGEPGRNGASRPVSRV